MKHFHHSIAFTLNERRFIYWAWTPPAGEVYESESGTDPEPNPASDKSESKDKVPLKMPKQVEDAAKDRSARVETAMKSEKFFAYGRVPIVIDNPKNEAAPKVPEATREPAKGEPKTPEVAQADTAPTAPTLPPSNEAIPLEPATAEAPKPNEVAGTTQEVSTEKPAPEVDALAEPKAPEQTDEKLPETHREALQKQMDASMAILKDTGASAADKIAAAIGMMGLLKDLMERAYKGTLDEKLGKDGAKATDKPTDKPADGSPDSSSANLSPQESAQKKVEENAEVQPGKKTPEDFNKNIDEVKEKNQVERKSNTTEIAELDTTIDETKKENDGLIDARGGLEKELNGLNGKEGSEGKQKILQAKIENINDKIAANTKLISALDTQRDTFVEQNKKLDEEDTELDRMKKDVNETLAKVTELLEQIVKLLKEQGLDAKMPKINIAVNPDGSTEISAEGKNQETSATVEVKEGGEKDLATVNELQDKLVQTVQTQEKSIRAQVDDGANSKLGFAKNIGLGMLNSLGIEQTEQSAPKNVLSGGEIQLDGSTITYDTAAKQWKSSGDLTQENQKIITSMNQDLKNITDQIAKLAQVA